MTTERDESYEELRRVMLDVVRTEIGFNDLFAAQISDALIRGLSKRLRGRNIYLPASPAIKARNEEIRRRNNGNNRDALCREFCITRDTFYRVIKSKNPAK